MSIKFRTVKMLACGIAAVSVMGAAQPAYAGHDGDHGFFGFTGHHELAYEDYLHLLSNEQKLELHEYLNYEHREPCQNYREIPVGFTRVGCDLEYIYPVAEKPAPAPQRVQVAEQTTYSAVLTSYEIHFGFDSAALETQAEEVINRVASEITTYKPSEVTVAGYTDKAGPNDYNVKLSERRAQAVSDALTGRGVPNRVVTEEAYGETVPAVDTNDGVPLRENRRVVIEFRK